ACGVALLLLRWPTFFWPKALNHDELEFDAIALALVANRPLGLFLDGGTSGPLNSWYLAIPGLLGFGVTLVTGRVMALACVWSAVAACFGALRQTAGEAVARLAVVTLVAWMGLTQFFDFLHPATEHLPIALIAVSMWLLARMGRAAASQLSGLAFALGLVCGAIPFAKLQATPPAVTTLVFGALAILRRTRGTPARRTAL